MDSFLKKRRPPHGAASARKSSKQKQLESSDDEESPLPVFKSEVEPVRQIGRAFAVRGGPSLKRPTFDLYISSDDEHAPPQHPSKCQAVHKAAGADPGQVVKVEGGGAINNVDVPPLAQTEGKIPNQVPLANSIGISSSIVSFLVQLCFHCQSNLSECSGQTMLQCWKAIRLCW